MKTEWRLVGALVVGVVLGAVPVHLYEGHRSERQPDEEWLYVDYTKRIIEDTDSLTSLRAGETDQVIELLERDLSWRICDLVQDFPTAAFSDRASIQVLGAAARYRSAHPFQLGSADEDKMVAEALAKVGQIKVQGDGLAK